MNHIQRLAQCALAFVIAMATLLVFLTLVRVLGGLEISGEPAIADWSKISPEAAPPAFLRLQNENHGLRLERVRIVKRPVRRLFSKEPHRIAETWFSCWQVVDQEMLSALANDLRIPDERYAHLNLHHGSGSKFKPAWWPGDLVLFGPEQGRAWRLSDPYDWYVSLADRTRLYR